MFSRRSRGPVLGLDIAVVLGYGFGMVTAFLLNRALVFEKCDRPAGQEFPAFVSKRLESGQ